MQSSQLKVAKIVDSQDLANIHSACFAKPWTRDDVAKYLQRSGCYGLWIEGAAFVIFEIIEDECEIKTIAVLASQRRKNIAYNLCQEVVDVAKEFVVKKIFLEVSTENEAAIGLYQKLGFNEYNRRKDYYKIGEDALLMQFIL